MHLPFCNVRIRISAKPFVAQVVTAILLCLLAIGVGSLPAQLPTAASVTVPIATPAPTTVPVLPTLTEIATYNAARTPQISVTLTAGSLPVSVTTGDGTLAPISLPPSPTPVAVVLSYPSGEAGQVVWVQPLQDGGTLSAIGPDGKTYDGSRGFYLTLSVLNTVTFTYQAPRIAGTYQVLTRFSNVLTIMPFSVSSSAP